MPRQRGWVIDDARAKGGARCHQPAPESTRAFRFHWHALRVLTYSLPAGAGPDATLQIIVATVRAGIANAELVRIQDIGPLAEGIFDRIASGEETQTRGLYSTEAMDEYSKELGRRVRSEEIQNVVQQLQGANIIMRLGHGAYTVVDSFVREMSLERKARLSSAD
jgi:hypothetical protein